jgi:outer membrane biosynthesis protein TonB
MTDFSTAADSSPSFPEPPRRAPRHAAEQGYKRALQLSFGLHVAAILLVIFKTLVFPSKPKPYVPSLRVDMVALPDVLKKDLQNLPLTQSAKEIAEALKSAEKEAKKVKPIKLPDVEKAEPDELVLKPKKVQPDAEKSAKREKKLSSALDRIKSLAKLEKEIKSEAKAAGVIIKGNKTSKGSSLSGNAKESDARYEDAVLSKLQQNWSLPVWLSRQNLSAKVRIFIDSRGRIRSFRFDQASGNAQFDAAIKRTLDESQPFPAPPESVASAMLVDGIALGFPL